MHVPCGDEGSEIERIDRHEYNILLDASGQYVVIRCTQPTEIAWMQGNMNPLGV